MKVNIIKLFNNYNVEYQTTNHDTYIVNTQCSFCGGSRFKQGWSEQHSNCFNCGFHSLEDSLSDKLGLSTKEINKLIYKYKLKNNEDFQIKKEKRTFNKKEIKIPGSVELNNYQKNYLKKRKFDYKELQGKYKIQGAFPIEKYKNQDISNRIIIPIFNEKNQCIAWQARSVKPNDTLRYSNIPLEDCIENYKESLFNIQNCKNKNNIVVLEGVFDVFRWGDGSCCTYGTSLVEAQIVRLSKYKRVIIIFDSEIEAQKKAMKLASIISSFGIECINIDLEDTRDIAEYSQEEINKIKRQLF